MRAALVLLCSNANILKSGGSSPVCGATLFARQCCRSCARATLSMTGVAEPPSRAVLWMSALPCLRLEAASAKWIECARSWLCFWALIHSTLWSSGSTAVSMRVCIVSAMVILAPREATSSEGRALRTQSVPVRSALMTAVQGWGLRGVAWFVSSVAHGPVCRV